MIPPLVSCNCPIQITISDESLVSFNSLTIYVSCLWWFSVIQVIIVLQWLNQGQLIYCYIYGGNGYINFWLIQHGIEYVHPSWLIQWYSDSCGDSTRSSDWFTDFNSSWSSIPWLLIEESIHPLCCLLCTLVSLGFAGHGAKEQSAPRVNILRVFSWGTWRKSTQTHGEHVNSMQRGPLWLQAERASA